MRIMLLAAADSIHAVRWADAFVQNGNEVHFVTLSEHREKKDVINPNVKMYYLRINGFKGYVLNSFELRRLWKEINPDVISVHYASGYGLLARYARIHPTVLSVWGSDVYVAPYKSKLSKYIIKKNLNGADAIASTSNVMANQTRRIINDMRRDITITPFGVNINTFSPKEKKDSENIFRFGTIKKFTPIYGIENIIKAFGLFYQKWKIKGLGPIPHLFICGKGPDGDKYKQLRDNLGLSDLVTIEGYVANNKVPDLLNTFDVFCLGSISESFGVSAVEAMACGLPVIATDADGFVEIIENEHDGLIVPKNSIEEMAEKMEELYFDKSKCRMLGENARKKVIEKYNWSNNQLLLINLLNSVALTGKNK